MNVTLDIPPDTEARLREKATRHGQALPDYLLTLAESDVFEERDRTDAEDQADFEEATAAIREALADFDAGDRGILLEDYRAQIRAKPLARRSGAPG